MKQVGQLQLKFGLLMNFIDVSNFLKLKNFKKFQ